jgi:hypothetical protein
VRSVRKSDLATDFFLAREVSRTTERRKNLDTCLRKCLHDRDVRNSGGAQDAVAGELFCCSRPERGFPNVLEGGASGVI